jgi:signal transduction histidine kinase
MRPLSNIQYAYFLFIASLSYQICGIICYLYVVPGESLFTRLPLTLIGILFSFVIIKVPLQNRTIDLCMYFLIVCANLQFSYLTFINSFNYFYSCGLFTIVAASCILIFDKKILGLYILFTNTIIVVMVLGWFPENRFHLMLFNMISFSFILYYFQIGKIRLINNLNNAVTDLKESKKVIGITYAKNLQAAHDLASPVSAINVAADGIKYENSKSYKLLLNSIERINQISGSLLRHHNENKSAAESQFFDLENNISQIIEDKRKEFSDIKNLFIMYRISSPILHEVKIPKSEFYRVFSNILNNCVDALKETDNKRIKVVISPLHSEIEILIIDNGSGIEPENQENIFLENVSYKKNGTGIGLSYAKKTIESWGGSISLLKSNTSGTTFRLVIPSC